MGRKHNTKKARLYTAEDEIQTRCCCNSHRTSRTASRTTPKISFLVIGYKCRISMGSPRSRQCTRAYKFAINCMPLMKTSALILSPPRSFHTGAIMCGETQYKISISAAWVQAFLYGLYTVLFAASIYVLVWHRPNKRNLLISVALFVFTTADVFLFYSLTILTPNTASTSYLEGDGIAPCPGADLAARAREGVTYNLLSLLTDVAYAVNFVLADGLLISRCVTIWSTTRWIVVPLGLLLAGTTACNIASIYYDSVVYVAEQNPHAVLSALLRLAALNNRFLEVGDILSLATNVITTSLIVFKIWRMTCEIERAMGRRAGVRYRAAMAMLIESGALFSASLVTSLASAYASVNFDIAEVFVAMLMGIAPTLIIVRVGLGKGFETVQDSLHESNAGHASAPVREQEMSRIRFQAMQSSVSDDHMREDKVVGVKREAKPVEAVEV